MNDIHENALNDNHPESLIDAALSLLPEIRGMVEEIDDARQLPDRLVNKLADAGFFRMMVDRDWAAWRLIHSPRHRWWKRCPKSAHL